MKVQYVDWLDPRAVAQRDAMNAETGAMYAKFVAGQSPETNAAVDDALSIDAADIIATLIAVDDDSTGSTGSNTVLGHAALRVAATSVTGSTLEVKKVFVGAGNRGRGVARLLMSEIEVFARARGAVSLVLQTGDLQLPAIRLYEDLGYRPIPIYGKYVVMPNSLCFEKVLEP